MDVRGRDLIAGLPKTISITSAEIREALEARTGTRVRLRTEIDPSLLSGFVVRLGSEVFDASLARRLTRARKALEGAAGAA